MRLHLLLPVTLIALAACSRTPVTPPPLTESGALSGTGAVTGMLDYPHVLVMALNGNHDAEFELGAMFEHGDGVEKDLAKAKEWYEKAAQAGNRQAAFNLGMMHRNGEGIDVNLDAARRWFVRASDAGDVRAAYQLGQMSYLGRGTEQNYERALQYYLKAAKGGLADAQMNVGVMHVRGEGVPTQDVVEAYAWLKIASENGAERSQSLLTSLSAQITPEQKTSGDARAMELRKEIKAPGLT